MKPQTIYIEHKIDVVNDLPKKDGWYIVRGADNQIFRQVNYHENLDQHWMDYYDLWLKPVPVPEDSEIDEQSKKFTHPLVWRFGVTWLMGKLKLK